MSRASCWPNSACTSCPSALPGDLDDFSFESYLNLPTESEAPQPDLHSRMEARLGLATKPAARGML